MHTSDHWWSGTRVLWVFPNILLLRTVVSEHGGHHKTSTTAEGWSSFPAISTHDKIGGFPWVPKKRWFPNTKTSFIIDPWAEDNLRGELHASLPAVVGRCFGGASPETIRKYAPSAHCKRRLWLDLVNLGQDVGWRMLRCRLEGCRLRWKQLRGSDHRLSSADCNESTRWSWPRRNLGSWPSILSATSADNLTYGITKKSWRKMKENVLTIAHKKGRLSLNGLAQGFICGSVIGKMQLHRWCARGWFVSGKRGCCLHLLILACLMFSLASTSLSVFFSFGSLSVSWRGCGLRASMCRCKKYLEGYKEIQCLRVYWNLSLTITVPAHVASPFLALGRASDPEQQPSFTCETSRHLNDFPTLGTATTLPQGYIAPNYPAAMGFLLKPLHFGCSYHDWRANEDLNLKKHIVTAICWRVAQNLWLVGGFNPYEA